MCNLASDTLVDYTSFISAVGRLIVADHWFLFNHRLVCLDFSPKVGVFLHVGFLGRSSHPLWRSIKYVLTIFGRGFLFRYFQKFTRSLSRCHCVSISSPNLTCRLSGGVSNLEYIGSCRSLEYVDYTSSKM